MVRRTLARTRLDGREAGARRHAPSLRVLPHQFRQHAPPERALHIQPLDPRARREQEYQKVNTASAIYRQFLDDAQQQTGRSAEAWKALLQANGLVRHSDGLRWLQQEHGLPDRAAYLLASHADESRPDYTDEAGLLQALYSLGKQALRDLHDALTELVMLLGSDVTMSVGKTMVTFRRKHVFAQIKPASKTRIDFGLALPLVELPPTTLIPTGGFEKGDPITYRITISEERDIDANLERWLERAYSATAAGPA